MQTSNSKTIRIAVRGADVVPIERLRIIQDDLKSLSRERYLELRGEIEKWGVCFALHVWVNEQEKTLDILDGTQRIRVLREMIKEGWTLPGVPVCFVEAANEREAVLKCLAGAGMYGHPESDGLYALMMKHGLTMADVPNIALPGIDMPTFEAEFFKDAQADAEGEDEVPPVPPVEARTKPGELWLLGRHRLLCGDATKPEDVERLMGGEKADMVFTDPPYGMRLDCNFSSMKGSSKILVGNRGNEYRQIKGDGDDFSPELIRTVFSNFTYCAEIFLWGADYYSEELPDRNNGSWIVWDKRQNDAEDDSTAASADKAFGSAFELCWSKTKHKRTFARIRSGIFGVKNEAGTSERSHPTQKPVQLAEWFFSMWGATSKLIADTYLGSGSTLIACEKTDRRCFGMEIDPAYCDVIITRWEEYSGGEARREDGTPWSHLATPASSRPAAKKSPKAARTSTV
jgi:DNA modification methylase